MYKDDEIKFLNILAGNHNNCDYGDDPFLEGLGILFSIMGTVELRRSDGLYIGPTINKLIAHNISERMMHALHSCEWFAYEEDEGSGIYYLAHQYEE